MSDTAPTTQLLLGLSRGDQAAVNELLPRIYRELKALAASFLRHERPGHTLQTTALVHEAYLRLIGKQPLDPLSRSQFFALAARAMRNVLVDHARTRDAQKRGGAGTNPSPDAARRARVDLDDVLDVAAARGEEVLALDEALHRLAALDQRQAQVVELRFFGGMSVAETAAILGVSARTVEGDWSLAKARLKRELKRKVP